MRALKDSAPDLSISSEDVNFSPEVPIEGQPVTITASIHNQGGKQVNDVRVVIGDRSSVIGEEIIPTIGAGESREVSFDWLAEAGTNEFEIIIDPDNLIPETNEDNNSVYFFLTPGTKPDLTLSDQDITFSPPAPQVGDPELLISANVYNKGETPADNFRVELTANSQQLTAYNITTIPGGRYVLVQALISGNYQLHPRGVD